MATFSQSGSAVASGTGTATVTVRGPHRVGTTWELGQAVLSATVDPAPNTSCEARLYRSFVHPSQLLGTSLGADADTMEGLPGDVLSPGDTLVVVFIGCAPGSTANVNVRGREILATV